MPQKASRVQATSRAVSQRRRSWAPFAIGLLAVLLISAIVVSRSRIDAPANASHDHAPATAGHSDQAIDLPHIHGLGFGPDGRELIVPAHDGLRIFVDGAWHTPDVPAHDYMGFVVSDDGFYSSGHPAPGSNLVNPLGLVKSTDGGKTLDQLGFQRESDFHLMGVGYRSHVLYVFNPTPNSQLAEGLYWSEDDGATWQQSAMRGLDAAPISIAVHPTDANVVAIVTESGLFVSSDHGDTFERVSGVEPITAATFNPDGSSIVFGATSLARYDMASRQVELLRGPTIEDGDALSYIAMNPSRADELAVATFERNIYRSQDAGQSWQQIAEQGKGLQLAS